MDMYHVYRFFLWALFIWIQRSLTDGQTIFNERFIGCFRDDGNDRVFPVYISQSILVPNDFTVEKCIDECIALSMAYAGVQYQQECFCGGARTDYDRLGELPLDDCKVYICRGNQDQYCGGLDALLVYNTTVMVPDKLQTATAELSSTSDTSTLRTFITNSTELFPTTSGSTTTKTPMIPAINSIALYAGLGGGGATIAILIIVVITIVFNRRKRMLSSPTEVVPPEKPYMDLEPTNNSQATTYESLGTGSVSKVEDGSYENQTVVKQHQFIHQVTMEDEHPYELPALY
ncbi:sialate:O-sulfotransferase 1-like [Lytechinus pictus]|uniref:sialate:O-sulfotransferase 1-like n=1 Tax=Lytechinus pictus TaxID=7653 RepID=UPI0030B9BA6B